MGVAPQATHTMPVNGAPESMTISEFCQVEKISVPLYYKLKKKGLAPDEVRIDVPGVRVIRITPTSRARWHAMLAERAATKESELERQRRAAQRVAAGRAAAASPQHVSRKGNARAAKGR
jgi:hypothetical protein